MVIMKYECSLERHKNIGFNPNNYLSQNMNYGVYDQIQSQALKLHS